MSTVADILALADRYCAAAGIAPSTLSTRVFNDGKILARLQAGGDVTTGRAAGAIRWFSDNWPKEAQWPESVGRPVRQEVADAAFEGAQP